MQDCLALGSILAATDSVATLQVISQDRFPLLYSVVFGEVSAEQHAGSGAAERRQDRLDV